MKGTTISCLIMENMCQRFSTCLQLVGYFNNGERVIWLYESREENTELVIWKTRKPGALVI